LPSSPEKKNKAGFLTVAAGGRVWGKNPGSGRSASERKFLKEREEKPTSGKKDAVAGPDIFGGKGLVPQ